MVTGFHFSRSDFQACTGKKEDAQHLRSRFNELKTAIENTQIFNQEFADFKGYVPKSNIQGTSRHKDYMWLGFAHNKYNKPRDEVQLQVTIAKNEPLRIELFIDQAARETRQKVKTIIEKNKNTFVNLIRDLSKYHVGYFGDSEYFQKECRFIGDSDITRILEKIGERHIHFFVGKLLSKNEIYKLKEEISLEIIYTWFQLRPVYDLVTIGKVSIDNFKSSERPFSSKEIDLNETEAKASERECKQVTYETNWLAQEKANRGHRKTVRLLAKYLKDNGVKQPQQTKNIDVFAESDNCLFIFEVKTIHTHNYIYQTRSAIGQLLDYEYFKIKSKFRNKGKDIKRAIVYSEKPAEKIIGFLMAYQFLVFWIEAGNLSGNKESMEVLNKFLSGT